MFGVGGVTSNRGSTFNVTGATGCGYGAGGGGGMVNAAGGSGTNGFVLVEW
ncbi:hypothetical protein SDC9_145155 [bioreactor metagenome]|uniref:Uncharacterized protein n=1 Tax=bioreactor metagenome TaxID=1076179 RepID=A0A645E7R2_9ZZZZ